MANLIGLRRRQDDEAAAPDAPRLVGPLHAVAAPAGQVARETSTEAPALCGELVEIVAVEDVPDDTGLCRACQYGD